MYLLHWLLSRVNDKMVENQSVFNVEEAQAVMRHISELNKSLVTGEKEKHDLLMVSETFNLQKLYNLFFKTWFSFLMMFSALKHTKHTC